MEPIAAAIEHLHLMETRIRQQEAAIEALQSVGQDASDAARRLKLLHAAIDEMRIQLAQLTPTEAQASDPIWVHKLGITSGRSARSASGRSARNA